MEKETKSKLQVVALWHEALNSKHKEGLTELVKENVKMIGPKGDVEGVNIMLDWVDRSNITLTPKRYFQSNDTVVVEEFAVWHEKETEREMDSAIVASVFILDKGLITSIQRFDSLSKAFEATGLTENYLVEVK